MGCVSTAGRPSIVTELNLLPEKSGHEIRTMKVFSIITKPANSLLQDIHDRMPVILSSEESKDYLEHNNSNYLTNNAQSIFEEYFEFFKISKFVNNPINNSSECFKPIN